jgi:hypothetical protein
MESTRKDFEGFFGRLKGRFRFLKLPFLLHDVKDIKNVFFTCCILHNMLLQYDGLYRWDGEAGNFGDDGELGPPLVNHRNGLGLRAEPTHDDSRLGRGDSLMG